MSSTDPVFDPVVPDETDVPCTPPEYALKGPQVEPEASYWNHCPQLRIVSVDELRAITDDPGNPGYFPPYPDPCTAVGRNLIEREMDELIGLQELRDEPCSLVGPCDDASGCLSISPSPCSPVNPLPFAFGYRAPISRLFDLMPPALGAVQANRLPGERVIRTGRGMARAVEAETPGIFHRHALNFLITTRSWSPPRQALIWAALDVALASALQAAWYYKWLSTRPLTSRRPRPIEYAVPHGIDLQVLYDRPDELNPRYITCPDARPCASNPGFSPGTPRHPAYPSGHSTYAGAASTILGFFFGNNVTPPVLRLSDPFSSIGTELRHMADNIGLGRMWAGIHWRSDHEAGLKLGQVVGCLVLRQLASICGGDFVLCPPEPGMVSQCDCSSETPCPDDMPPSIGELEDRAQACQDRCDPCGVSSVEVPAPCGRPVTDDPDQPVEPQVDLRSVQAGGQTS